MTEEEIVKQVKAIIVDKLGVEESGDRDCQFHE